MVGEALIKVLSVGSNRVEIGIEAPREISVHRISVLDMESLPSRGMNGQLAQEPQ